LAVWITVSDVIFALYPAFFFRLVETNFRP
jgi:hypothetical protein